MRSSIKFGACFYLFLLPLAVALAREDPKFAVSDIPDELLKGANAVVREDQMVFTISSVNSATLHGYFVVTILNEKEKHLAVHALNYDKLRKVGSFKAALYNPDGLLIRRLKGSDIVDQSDFEGLYGDNRVQIADLRHTSYPYTVEFEYDINYKYLYTIDGTYIQSEEHVAVQHASYQLVYPLDLKPRYKTHQISSEPVIAPMKNGLESTRWEVSNIKAIVFEPYSLLTDQMPRIVVAPSRFEYEGYAGDMSTWEGYGKWICSLGQDRGNLPESTKRKVAELTADVESTREKARLLYNYLQGRTRYVSIQLGIGGYQPFPATVVDETGYGDCKALSNYMVAMLAEAGVKANYTLVRAGRSADDIDWDFPSHQFDHVIVSVPTGSDTLWLECTNQRIPFGYLGSFTCNRHALAIVDGGARLVKTPTYSPDDNIQSRMANVTIATSGDARAQIVTTYMGLQYENGGLNQVLDGRADDQKKWVMEESQIPSFEINSFSFKQQKDMIPRARVELEMQMRRFASVSGKRLFITPNLMNRSAFIPEKNEDRKTEVVIRTGYTDIDTVIYEVPEMLYPEFLPEPVKITGRFGDYESTIAVDRNRVTYVRRVRIVPGHYPASSYGELCDFYRGINKADNAKLVFLSKT